MKEKTDICMECGKIMDHLLPVEDAICGDCAIKCLQEEIEGEE